MSKLQIIKDGFANILKGLGSSKDPRENIIYQRGRYINQQTANDLYTYNWLAAKVIDTPIDDATSKWRKIIIPDPDKKLEVEKAFEKAKVKSKINQALKWARVFGGGAIVIIIDGDDPKEPLVIERIKKDSLKNLIVLDRHNLVPYVTNRDILDENYGLPDYYTIVRAGNQWVHHSRVIPFYGIIPSIAEFEQQNFWGHSYFTRLWEPVSDSQITSQSINNLVYESNVDVYKIKNLYEMVANGQDDLVVKRLKIMHEMKSVVNGTVIDSEDDWDNKSKNFANLQDIDDRSMQKVSGASNIPMTRLVGISPAGMNSTGESDSYNYHDYIKSIQENEITPALDYLDRIIMMSAFQDAEGFDYAFMPLKQLTVQEQAQVDLNNSQRDKNYYDMDVVDRFDIMSNLAENNTYTSIDENRVKEEQEEFEKEEEIDFTSKEPEESGVTIPERIEQTGESDDTVN